MAPFGLNTEEVSSSFITNILSIFIFIGLVRFEDKDFWIYGGDFCRCCCCCCYFDNYLLLFLLLLLSLVAIFVILVFIIVIAFIIGVTIFIFIFFIKSFLFILLFFSSLMQLLLLLILFLFQFTLSNCYSFFPISIFVLLSSRLFFFSSKIWLLPLLSSS